MALTRVDQPFLAYLPAVIPRTLSEYRGRCSEVALLRPVHVDTSRGQCCVSAPCGHRHLYIRDLVEGYWGVYMIE